MDLIDSKPRSYEMINIMNEWREQYHTDAYNHDIIFQNKLLFSNIGLSDSVIDRLSGHSRGFANLPVTVIDPDEVWARWEDPDPDTQQIVLRNYIKIGQKSFNFVVQTRAGVVTDALAVVNSNLDRYRKGLKVML